MKGFDGNAETMAMLAYRLSCLSRRANALALDFERDKQHHAEGLREIIDAMRSIADDIHSNYF